MEDSQSRQSSWLNSLDGSPDGSSGTWLGEAADAGLGHNSTRKTCLMKKQTQPGLQSFPEPDRAQTGQIPFPSTLQGSNLQLQEHLGDAGGQLDKDINSKPQLGADFQETCFSDWSGLSDVDFDLICDSASRKLATKSDDRPPEEIGLNFQKNQTCDRPTSSSIWGELGSSDLDALCANGMDVNGITDPEHVCGSEAKNERLSASSLTLTRGFTPTTKLRRGRQSNPYILDEVSVADDEESSEMQISTDSERPDSDSFIDDQGDVSVSESQQVRYLKTTTIRDDAPEMASNDRPRRSDYGYEKDSFCVGTDDTELASVGDFTQSMLVAEKALGLDSKHDGLRHFGTEETSLRLGTSGTSSGTVAASQLSNKRSGGLVQEPGQQQKRRRVIESDSSDD